MNQRLGLTVPALMSATYVAGMTPGDIIYRDASPGERKVLDEIGREALKEEWKRYAKETGKFAISLVPFIWLKDELKALENSKSLAEANIHIGIIAVFGLMDAVAIAAIAASAGLGSGASTALKRRIQITVTKKLVDQGVEKKASREFSKRLANALVKNPKGAAKVSTKISVADSELRRSIMAQISRDLERRGVGDAKAVSKSILRNVENQAKGIVRKPRAIKPAVGKTAAAAVSGAEARIIPEKVAERQGTLFLLDTSYILNQLKKKRSLSVVFNELISKGDVAMTESILGEVKGNLGMFDNKTKAKALADIYECVSKGIISVDKIDVPESYVRELSLQLATLSEKANSRVGIGDASLMKYAESIGKELFEHIHVLSSDSDLKLLTNARKGLLH